MFSVFKLTTVLSLAFILLAPFNFFPKDLMGENVVEAVVEVSPARLEQLKADAGYATSVISGVNTSVTPYTFTVRGNRQEDYNGPLSQLWRGTNFSYYGIYMVNQLGGVTVIKDAQALEEKLSTMDAGQRQDLESKARVASLEFHNELYNAKYENLKVQEENPIIKPSTAGYTAGNGFNPTPNPQRTAEEDAQNQQSIQNRAAAQAAEDKALQQPEEIYCLRFGGIAGAIPEFSLSGCVARVAYIFLEFCSWILWIAAIFFNYIIDYTLNIKGFITRVPIVDIGWTTFRDFANLFFVFIILYIAINTIIGNSSYGIKSLLGKVIITAILINFSLFFTKVVIDTSNIFALQFYSKIIQSAGSHGGGASIDSWDSGISAAIADSMGLSDIWGVGKAAESTTGDAVLSSESGLGLNAANLIIVGFGGGLFILITAIVFIAGGLMLLFRTIVLLFLMILSPMAFVGGILPSTKGYVKEWWDKLFSNALYAPAYMALLYLVLSIVLNGGLSKGGSSFVDMFKGDTGFVDTLSTFVVLNCLMVGCIIIAKKIGAAGSSWAVGTATAAVGAASFGILAKTGRGVIGGAATAITRNWENPKNFATRGIHSALRGIAGSSFDARNVNGIGKKFGLGGGDTKGFKQRAEERTKALVEEAKNYGTEGKLAMAGSLQSRWRSNSSIKAGDDILKTGMSEDIQKQQDAIKEWKDNPDYKRFMKLAEQSTRTADEKLEMNDLYQNKLSGAKFKLSSYDTKTGTWTEDKSVTRPVDFDPATGQHKSYVDDQARHVFDAQGYLRAKKHTAAERHK